MICGTIKKQTQFARILNEHISSNFFVHIIYFICGLRRKENYSKRILNFEFVNCLILNLYHKVTQKKKILKW